MPTNFTGWNIPGAVDLPPGGLSTNLNQVVTFSTVPTVSRSTNFAGANLLFKPAGGAVSMSHSGVIGYRSEMFGGQLFEKVLVMPRVKTLGFVITATQFPVEVWNAFRDMDQTLTAITINGTGGLTLVDPFGEPLIFAALGSRVYQATV